MGNALIAVALVAQVQVVRIDRAIVPGDGLVGQSAGRLSFSLVPRNFHLWTLPGGEVIVREVAPLRGLQSSAASTGKLGIRNGRCRC